MITLAVTSHGQDARAISNRVIACFTIAPLDGTSMGKGRFVNQKLGKSVSRKSALLKSELSGRTTRKMSSRLLKPSLPKKGTPPGNG